MDLAEVSNLQAAFAYQSDILKGYQEQLGNLRAANDYLTQYIQSLLPSIPKKVSLALPNKSDRTAEQCKGK